MANPILIDIRKKVKVPTKNQRVYLWRSEWQRVGRISYYDSSRMFKEVNGSGLMETDAHFAKWLLESFGEGVYLCLAVMKGRKGFWNFMKVEVNSDGSYMRLRRGKSQEEKDKGAEIGDYQQLQKRLSESNDPNERKELIEELENSEKMIEDYTEDINSVKKKRRGCSPYLKSLQPMYKKHQIEDFTSEEISEEKKRWF